MYAALVIFSLFNLYHGVTGLYEAYGGSAKASSFNYATASDGERRAFLEHVATSTADAMRPTDLGEHSDLLKTQSVVGVFDHDTKTIRIEQIVGVDLLDIKNRRLLETTIFEKNCQIVTSELSKLDVSIELEAKTKSGQRFYRVLLSEKACALHEANAQFQDFSSN